MKNKSIAVRSARAGAGLALLFLSTAASPLLAQPLAGPQDVMAMVNGEVISRVELEQEVLLMEQQLLQEGREVPAGAGTEIEAQALESLIDQALLYQAGLERGYRAEPAAVEQNYRAFRGRFPDRKLFEDILGRFNHTPESFREKLERNLTVQRFVEAEISAGLEITAEEARAFYEENPGLFQHPEGRIGFAEIRPNIVEHLLQARTAEEVAVWLERLRAQAVIERLPLERV